MSRAPKAFMSYVNLHDQHEQGPPTVAVDARKLGDYVSITDALKAAVPGTRILVRPGLYQEGIVIDKPVEIVGDGERNEIVIEATDEAAVLFKADNGRIANLTLRHTNSRSGYFCVDIAQGRLELEDCDISGQGNSCVAIHSGADPRLRRCRVYHGRDGIFVMLNGQGTLEDNEIFANEEYGVVITSGCSTTLRRNRISKNGRSGWLMMNGGGGIFVISGQGTLEDNEIFANTGYGVVIVRSYGAVIAHGDNPTILRRNRITQNSDLGIRVGGGGVGGIFEDNDLRGNAKGAWNIDPCCEREVQRRGNKE